MFRWVLVILGLVVAYVSVDHWLAFEPLEESAMPTSAQDAAALLQSQDRQFILLDAKLDTGKRMYRTGINTPAYAAWPRNAVQPLSNADLDRPAVINRLLGCEVEIKSPVDATPMIIETILKNGQQPSTWTIQKRWLAVVQGSQGRIFVLSPVLGPDPRQEKEGDDDPEAVAQQQARWLQRASFKGLLTRLADLPVNTPGMNQRVADIKSQFTQHGIHIPRSAFVILTPEPGDTASSTRSQALPNILPIADSGGRLFLEASKEQEQTLATPIDGVLLPVDGQRYRDFARIMGEALPSRIGIIKLQTAAQYNYTQRLRAISGLGAALACASWGLILIYRKGYKKRRQIREWQECRKAVEMAKRRPMPATDPAMELITRLGR